MYNKKTTNYEKLVKKLMKDPIVKAAHDENEFRRYLADSIKRWIVNKGYSDKDIIKLAKISKSQLDRLLHKEVGGLLYLSTIIRVLNVFDLKLSPTPYTVCSLKI